MIEKRILTEKYRPSSLDEVVGNSENTEMLKSYVNDDRVPNILFEGPAGVGKTASAQAFAREVFGSTWKSNFIDFNASDDRGIDVVRDDIKTAARQAAVGHEYKIIFLDEVDSTTKDAQSALRRTMERFSDQTAFFLSCNYKNKLIDPIQSRCTVLSYNRLSDDEIRTIIERVLTGEDIDASEESIEKIIEYVDGDARRALNSIQSSTRDDEINLETLAFPQIRVTREEISEVVELSVNSRMEEAMDRINGEIIPEITDYGGFCRDLLFAIKTNENINNDVRWFLMGQVGELERNMMEGASPEVQINSFIAKIPVAQYSSISNYE